MYVRDVTHLKRHSKEGVSLEHPQRDGHQVLVKHGGQPEDQYHRLEPKLKHWLVSEPRDIFMDSRVSALNHEAT